MSLASSGTQQKYQSGDARGSLRGFTLIEMIVAIGIFSIVIWSTVAIVVSASEAQAKASELRTIQDNIRFAVEYMTKELRTGRNVAPSQCAGSLCGRVAFTNDRGQSIMYCVSNDVLIRSVIGNCDSSPTDETKNIHLTSDDVVVSSLSFITQGTAAGPSDGQPMTTVILHVSSAPGKTKLFTSMNLQTTVTQRLRDL